MRRFLFPLLILLIACQAITAGFWQVLPVTPALPPASPATATVSPPAETPTAPASTPVAPPTPTAANPPASLVVRLHPDGPLYVGDQVSFEVTAAEQRSRERRGVQVRLGSPDGALLGEAQFGRYGIGSRLQATLMWIWNTAGLDPGEYMLFFNVTPAGPDWTETVTLLPADQVPPPEPQAAWMTAETDCCLVHYISGTDAARDLEALLPQIDEQFRLANERLHIELEQPVQITLLPRVIGHGGFAGNEISVSYLDRNYAGSDIDTVLHHEMVHILDGRLGGDFRPTMLVEGLAVYLTGGHFKPEPLMPRAAALLPPRAGCTQAGSYVSYTLSLALPACGLNRYVPLRDLADDFYFKQHEIGYLEAGSLIEYMVQTWGWDNFSSFYRDMQPPENGEQSQAMELALQKHFNISLEALDQQFQAALKSLPLDPKLVEDVQTTVNYYDMVRLYQEELDPSAYFLTAWLPDPAEMRKRGIVADFLRRPSQPENIALETLLVGADHALRHNDYARAQRLTAAVGGALDALDVSSPGAQAFLIDWVFSSPAFVLPERAQ